MISLCLLEGVTDFEEENENSNKVFIFLITLLLIMTNIVLAEERDEGYFTIKDKENGEIIFETARYVYVGDEYLNEDNKLYRVIEIEQDTGLQNLLKKSI